MNAKQKANELVERLMPYTDTAGDNCFANEAKIINKTQAKSVAIIMVEEILSLKLWGKTDGENDRDFWVKVKAEIYNVQPKNDMQCGVGKNNI